MTEIKFEDLPRAVSGLFKKLEKIENLLLLKNNETQPEPDQWFDLNRLL